jgi:UDP-2,3-diacylglucosamine pyrophosphatase LpxH
MIMRTEQRLTEVYNGARVEYFDENSKYVFFSDCHRSNGSHSDEFLRNRNNYLFALEYYYKNGFTYVEAGDGDELWEHPHFRDIKNAHSAMFDVLKRFFYEDRLIMLYGNHNIYLKNQKYVESNYYTYYNNDEEVTYDFMKGLKPCEGLVLKHRNTQQEILVVHGHQGDFSNDQFWFPSMLALKYFWRFLHAVGAKLPSSPVGNLNKRHKIEKNYVKWIEKHKKMIICGHTHRVKYPKDNELPYFNIGCCVYPNSITNIEITGGEILLVKWSVLPDEDGVLQIRRQILMGPNPIEKYDISKR